MPKVAVVQDGTELARQAYADIAGCFERSCELISADGLEFSVQLFTDEGVGSLLDQIESGEYACLVFASNALLSVQVEQALNQRHDKLSEYLRAGGGIVLMHQFRENLSLVLPEDLCPEQVNRVAARGGARAQAYDGGDVLLQYPAGVNLDTLRDGGSAAGPPSLYYKALVLASLGEKLKPVLVHGTEGLLARTYDHVPERVVIATPPLDWQGYTEMLANAIRYASFGTPRRLMWESGQNSEPELLRRWLSIDGNSSIRPMPALTAMNEVDRWLLGAVDILVIPPEQLPAVEQRPEVLEFLARGGSIVTADRVLPSHASRITTLVGNYVERALAARLYGELRAIPGWQTIEYAFELRNIVAALAFLGSDPVNRTLAAVDLGEISTLRTAIRDRLRDPGHREDLSSSIVLAQTLFLLNRGRLDARLIEWMEGDPRGQQFEVGLQIRALGILARRQPDDGLLTSARAALEANRAALNSLAPVVRILDTIAVLDQAGLLGEPAGAAELTAFVSDLLDEHPPDLRAGWLSVEATADIVRGLLTLLSRLPADQADLTARVADHVGTGVTCLRRAFRRFERNPKGVAWLARLVHAVVLAEQRFPLGLQRLAMLEWPETSDGDGSPRTTPASLLEHLSRENRDLRQQQREAERQRLAASVGRGVVTTLLTAVVAVPFAWIVLSIGFTSVWTLISNLAIIVTLPLIAVAGIYALLSRWGLLARPMAIARHWLVEVVPLLGRLTGASRDKVTNP